MINLELALAKIEQELEREEFDAARQMVGEFRTAFPDYASTPKGYLIDFYEGSAIFRKEAVKRKTRNGPLREAKAFFETSLTHRGDFAPAHYLEALVSIMLSRNHAQDAIYHDLEANYHLERAEQCDNAFHTEVEKQRPYVRKQLETIPKVILCSRDQRMVLAWEKEFGQYSWVQLIEGDILKQRADAIVSPANSFGCMDGGLDYQLSEFFGWNIQKKLQRRIREKYDGELLVGQAEVVETGKSEIPYMISAPTMRVPMIIQDTVNPYLAMRAVFCAVKEYNASEMGIHSVLIPGLGTGVGEVPFEIAARQMRAGYERSLLGRTISFSDFAEAQLDHRALASQHFYDLYKGASRR